MCAQYTNEVVDKPALISRERTQILVARCGLPVPFVLRRRRRQTGRVELQGQQGVGQPHQPGDDVGAAEAAAGGRGTAAVDVQQASQR